MTSSIETPRTEKAFSKNGYPIDAMRQIERELFMANKILEIIASHKRPPCSNEARLGLQAIDIVRREFEESQK